MPALIGHSTAIGSLSVAEMSRLHTVFLDKTKPQHFNIQTVPFAVIIKNEKKQLYISNPITVLFM